MNAELQIQIAVYAALRASTALGAILAEHQEQSGSAVYDHVPQAVDSGDSARFPYVVVGDDTAVEWDTDTELGADSTVTIHSYSTYRGLKQTKEIQGAIYDALHRAALAVTGYDTVDCLWEMSQSFLEPDGLVRHGVQRFRVVVQDDGESP